MSRGETRSEGEKTDAQWKREKKRQKMTQTVSRKKSRRERVYSTHLWGGPGGTTWVSTEQRNEEQVLWCFYRVMLDKLSVWHIWAHPSLLVPSGHCFTLWGCSVICAVDQKMALAVLLWVIKWLRTSLVQPKKEIITSGILSYTLLKFIVIYLSFAQFLNCLETKLGYSNF